MSSPGRRRAVLVVEASKWASDHRSGNGLVHTGTFPSSSESATAPPCHRPRGPHRRACSGMSRRALTDRSGRLRSSVADTASAGGRFGRSGTDRRPAPGWEPASDDGSGAGVAPGLQHAVRVVRLDDVGDPGEGRRVVRPQRRRRRRAGARSSATPGRCPTAAARRSGALACSWTPRHPGDADGEHAVGGRPVAERVGVRPVERVRAAELPDLDQHLRRARAGAGHARAARPAASSGSRTAGSSDSCAGIGSTGSVCTESIGGVRLARRRRRAPAGATDRIAANQRSPSAGSPVHRNRTDRVIRPASGSRHAGHLRQLEERERRRPGLGQLGGPGPPGRDHRGARRSPSNHSDPP